MFERTRLGSAAALAVSLTMVGSGIYTATQDTGGGGGGSTVDLASSVGSRTPTAASPDADAAGEARAPAFVETPGRRPEAPTAHPRVTVKQSPPPRTRQDPPRDRCYGYASNSATSDSNIVAETTTGTLHPLGPGETFAGTAAEQVIGFYIPTADTHVEIDYYSGTSGLYTVTHFVDVEEPRSYDVSQCDEATVTVTDPNQHPIVDELTPDDPQDPLVVGEEEAPGAAAPPPDLDVRIPQFPDS